MLQFVFFIFLFVIIIIFIERPNSCWARLTMQALLKLDIKGYDLLDLIYVIQIYKARIILHFITCSIARFIR